MEFFICNSVITKRIWRSNYQAILSWHDINYLSWPQFVTHRFLHSGHCRLHKFNVWKRRLMPNPVIQTEQINVSWTSAPHHCGRSPTSGSSQTDWNKSTACNLVRFAKMENALHWLAEIATKMGHWLRMRNGKNIAFISCNCTPLATGLVLLKYSVKNLQFFESTD